MRFIVSHYMGGYNAGGRAETLLLLNYHQNNKKSIQNLHPMKKRKVAKTKLQLLRLFLVNRRLANAVSTLRIHIIGCEWLIFATVHTDWIKLC